MNFRTQKWNLHFEEYQRGRQGTSGQGEISPQKDGASAVRW